MRRYGICCKASRHRAEEPSDRRPHACAAGPSRRRAVAELLEHALRSEILLGNERSDQPQLETPHPAAPVVLFEALVVLGVVERMAGHVAAQKKSTNTAHEID